MKIHQHILATVVALLSSYSSLSYAEDLTVKIKASTSQAKNPPLLYYTYKVPAKKEIIEESVKLWNNLNKYTNANLDVGLLKNAETAERINIKTDKILFDVYNPSCMGFLYTKPLLDFLHPDKRNVAASRLLDKNYAQIAAKNYLDKLELIPKLANEMYFEKTSTIRGAASTNPHEIFDYLQVVRFGRKLNALRVIGPTRIVLRLGPDGELVSIIKDWPQLVQSADDNVEMYDKAQWNQVVTSHINKKYEKSSMWSSIEVNDIEVVMYDDGESVVEPALYTTGNCIDKKGGSFAYDWVIPVSRKPKARYNGEENSLNDSIVPEEAR